MAAEKITPSQDQISAWGYYGLPRGSQREYGSKATSPQAVGEVRYVVGWMADQMVRMGWRLMIAESETWTLALPDGETVRSDAEQDDPEDETHPANASRKVLEAVGWSDATVRQVTTNLYVAGELYYVHEKKDGEDTWRVVSMVAKDLSQRVQKADLAIRGLWPHPADDDSPDAPIFGVLAVLDDLLWLTRLERSQSANRVGMRGLLLVADQLTLAKGTTSEQFWTDFEAALGRAMDDPEDVAPVGLRGPADLVDGGKGIEWIIPDFPYDDKIGDRMQGLIQRLAYGLPIPPEILLGLQAQSRATAFQVEGNAYRAHIEPGAWTVAQVAQDALTKLLPESTGAVRVIPDPTAILARRHSIEDVLQAYDRGEVGGDYLREALGIPERAKPEEAVEAADAEAEVIDQVDDPTIQMALDLVARAPSLFVAPGLVAIIEQLRAVLGDGGAAPLPGEDTDDEDDAPAPSPPPDEDEGQADDPVNAAVLATRVTETDADRYVSQTLARIDAELLAELIGAAEQAVVKAREKLGAAVRSKASRRDEIPAEITNDELAAGLGRTGLEALGIDVDKIIAGAIAATVRWWKARLARAQSDITDFLATGDVPIEFDQTRAAESVDLLDEALTGSVFEPTVEASRLREVIDLAGS